jgi:dodecin
MSVAKNIEITSTSTVSFQDAIDRGIERASRTIDNIRGAWIKEQKVNVSGGKVTEYLAMMIVTFVLAEDE